ncbi:hypothetical protein [Moorena sp. SIO3B2]|uniref:hypothetical protein n=1 Tax=Moorena sp. SIO3B2 TaxID=2607827 RepID=UPI0013C97032|nr:hypothetical protein [Moorena sp. SIO3B2]NEP33689.1 hypothetical protein [Moorena sp. SIO3B2]
MSCTDEHSGTIASCLLPLAYPYGVADSGYGFAPLAPQFWGEQDFQAMQRGLGGFPHERLHQDKSPKRGIARLGDLGGLTKTRCPRIHSLIQQRHPYPNTFSASPK